MHTPHDALKDEIHQLVHSEPIVLFMKGTPTFPRCGFSSTAAHILKACGLHQFAYVDMLEHSDMVRPLVEYADWPTLPALFVNGELVGGCDITQEMFQAGELQPLLSSVLSDSSPSPSSSPSSPRTSYYRQRGVGFLILLVIAILLIGVFFTVFKIMPVYIEKYSIDAVVSSLEQGMDDGASVNELRKRFDKMSFTQSIDSVTGRDLIFNDTSIGYAYTRKVPLTSKIYLGFEFEKH